MAAGKQSYVPDDPEPWHMYSCARRLERGWGVGAVIDGRASSYIVIQMRPLWPVSTDLEALKDEMHSQERLQGTRSTNTLPNAARFVAGWSMLVHVRDRRLQVVRSQACIKSARNPLLQLNAGYKRIQGSTMRPSCVDSQKSYAAAEKAGRTLSTFAIISSHSASGSDKAVMAPPAPRAHSAVCPTFAPGVES